MSHSQGHDMTKHTDSTSLPLARSRAELVIETLADEVLVYDQTAHRAHCLTPAAALVWECCHARMSRVEALTALAGSGSRESLDTVMSQLVSAGLVTAPRVVRDRVNASRRRFFGKTMVAAAVVVASPVVYSIVAPSVAEAASCGKSGQGCCTSGRPCNVPLTCTNPTMPSAGTCQ